MVRHSGFGSPVPVMETRTEVVGTEVHHTVTFTRRYGAKAMTDDYTDDPIPNETEQGEATPVDPDPDEEDDPTEGHEPTEED